MGDKKIRYIISISHLRCAYSINKRICLFPEEVGSVHVIVIPMGWN